jgi:hypothetical protein
MSSLADFDQYIGKKDLSKKAKESITKILCELGDDVPTQEIVSKALCFPQDVLGEYLLKDYASKDEAYKVKLVQSLIKSIEPAKFGHLFRAFCALTMIGDRERAFLLLCSKTETNLTGKDINKQIFQGFDKTLRDCSFDPFLQKFEEDKKRHLNIFASFLLKYMEYSKNDKINAQLIEFYTLNGLQIPKEVLTSSVAAAPDDAKTATPKEVSFEDLIAKVAKQYQELKLLSTAQSDKIKTDETELKKLRAELTDRNAEVSDLRGKVSAHQSQGERLKETLARTESELTKAQTARAMAERQCADLETRIKNIASANDAAGQQETDELRGKLSSRLKSSFDKFAEIRGRQPDLDYYEVLMLILEDVLKTLKKNGVEL